MLILNYQSLCQIYLSLLEGIQPRYHIERYTRYHIERYKWYHIDRYERYHLSAILTIAYLKKYLNTIRLIPQVEHVNLIVKGIA